MTESEAIKICNTIIFASSLSNRQGTALNTTKEELAEAMGMAIQALEKQIPKKPKHTYIKHGKHTWKKNENGEIDDFAWDYDYHNGVVCEVCGETVCVHCNPDYMELDDCEEEHCSCSSCGKEVYRNTKYCDCGQKLNWSEESEENNE